MNQVKKHIYYPLIGALTIVYTLGGIAWAINSQLDGYRVLATTTSRIEVHSDCRDVGSPYNDVFVPTRSLLEWNTFKTNKPSEIYVGGCGCIVGGTTSDIDVIGIPHRVHTFTSSQDVVVNCPGITVEYLVVGGGGGGGGRGGGGGGGGIRSGITSATGGVHPVVIGAGGARCTANSPATASCASWPTDGGASSIFGIIANGGGRGGNYNGGTGYGGGSGGGAGAKNCENTGTSAGGAGISGQGYNGGSTPNNRMGGGGGGGGGGVGGNSSGPTNYPDNCSATHWAGAGGIGFLTTIRGFSERFAGGGGGAGSANVVGGAGGAGGGGGAGSPGGANTGGGGGGGGSSSGNWGNSGRGGSGIVILRYRTSVHVVNFDANTGTGHSPTSKNIVYGNPVGLLPSNPTRTGHTFMGWFTSATGGTLISSSTPITADTTFFAQWLMTAEWEISGWSACSASPTWVATSGWSACSDAVAGSCGGGTRTRTRVCQNTSGTQTRTVVCRLSDGNTTTDSYCEQFSPKPATSQACSASCSGSTTESQSCNTECYGRWQRPSGWTSCNGLGNYAFKCYNGGEGGDNKYYNNGATASWTPGGVYEVIRCRVYTNSSCTNLRP